MKKRTLYTFKMMERLRELKEKTDKGEVTAEDVDTALILATILKKKFEED